MSPDQSPPRSIRPVVDRPAGSDEPPGPGSGSAPCVAVSVFADDRMTFAAIRTYLRSRREISVVPFGQDTQALLMLVRRLDDDLLDWARQAAETRPGIGFVFVVDEVSRRHLLRSVSYGPVSVVRRQDADFDRLVRALVGVPRGALEMPGEAIGWLMVRLRAIHQNALEPNGLNPIGLDPREAQVIRLLADGFETAQIADRLELTERTVRTVINGILTRWNLHNRAEAVAFALRKGTV